MRTYYAKDNKSAESYICQSGMSAEKMPLSCACGQSEGYVLTDEDGNEVEKIIVCEACWEDAEYLERL